MNISSFTYLARKYTLISVLAHKIVTHLFTHSFEKHLLSTKLFVSTMLDDEDVVVNRIQVPPFVTEMDNRQ